MEETKKIPIFDFLVDITNKSIDKNYILTTEEVDVLIDALLKGDLHWEEISNFSTYENPVYKIYLSEERGSLDNKSITMTKEDSDRINTIRYRHRYGVTPNNTGFSIDDTTSRFSGASWFEAIQEKTITLAGVGGIGSYVAFLLARLKPSLIYLYDDDTVETANLSGQLFTLDDVGNSKVFAACQSGQKFSNYYSMSGIKAKYTENSPATDIMICGFDNMKARKVFFQSWYKRVMTLPIRERKNCLLIDGRLAAEEFQVLALRGDDDLSVKRYMDEWLFDDAEGEETICSYKQTTFMANMIGSVMVNLFVNFVANQCNPMIDRDVPFFTYYEAANMYFKTEM